METVLGRVLWEVELRVAAAEQDAVDAEVARVLREHEWERAMVEAKLQHREAFLGRVLEAQAAACDRSGQLRAYLGGLREAVTRLPAGQGETDRGWLEWSTDYVDSFDPLSGSFGMPDVPDPRPQDLAPFLHGWSPRGPHQR